MNRRSFLVRSLAASLSTVVFAASSLFVGRSADAFPPDCQCDMLSGQCWEGPLCGQPPPSCHYPSYLGGVYVRCCNVYCSNYPGEWCDEYCWTLYWCGTCCQCP
jgi:hypothetical protein